MCPLKETTASLIKNISSTLCKGHSMWACSELCVRCAKEEPHAIMPRMISSETINENALTHTSRSNFWNTSDDCTVSVSAEGVKSASFCCTSPQDTATTSETSLSFLQGKPKQQSCFAREIQSRPDSSSVPMHT